MSWQPPPHAHAHAGSRRSSAKRRHAPSLSLFDQHVSPPSLLFTRHIHIHKLTLGQHHRPLPKSTSLTLPLPSDEEIDLGVLVTSATFCALPSPPLTSLFSPSTPSPTPTARAFLPLAQRGRMHAQPGERERTKKRTDGRAGFALRDVQAQREQAARDRQNGIVVVEANGVDINETIRPSNRPVPPAPGVAAFTHPHGRRRLGRRCSGAQEHAEARPIYVIRHLLHEGDEETILREVRKEEEEQEQRRYAPPHTHQTLQARAARAAALASASSSPHPHPLPHTRRTRTPTKQHVVLPLKVQRERTVRPSYARKHSAEEELADLSPTLRALRDRILAGRDSEAFDDEFM